MNLTLELSGLQDVLQHVAEEAVRRVLATQSERWLDVKAAADYLSISRKAVYDAVAKNGLPVHRTPTGRLLFRPSELDAWVLSGPLT